MLWPNEPAGCISASPEDDHNTPLFRIEVINVPLAHPEQAAIVSSPRIFNDLVAPKRHGETPEDSARSVKEAAEARARGAFVADICLLLLLTVVALRSRRYWPMFAAAFQLLCVVIHVARMFDPGVRGWAYATGEVIFTQWVFFAVGVGVINSWRASRQPAIEGAPTPDPGATLR
mgnify:CR=1 FL=1